LQLPNSNRGVISGQARSLVGLQSEANQPAPASGSTIAAPRSGSRGQLDRAFRRITLVGSQPTSLRRSGDLNRPQ
jgi:hypothetical protein